MSQSQATIKRTYLWPTLQCRMKNEQMMYVMLMFETKFESKGVFSDGKKGTY